MRAYRRGADVLPQASCGDRWLTEAAGGRCPETPVHRPIPPGSGRRPCPRPCRTENVVRQQGANTQDSSTLFVISKVCVFF